MRPTTEIASETATGRAPSIIAPMVRNAWYVVCERRNLGRELQGLTILGKPIVMYRTEAGEPVVLDDRCAHRRFPLSKSKLVGDNIQCGYHGFTFNSRGACVFAPGTPVDGQFGVHRYPVAERGPWVWAWAGDPALADIEKLPLPREYETPLPALCAGYTFNPCNYMLMFENILDLSHLHYLHGVADAEFGNTHPKKLDTPDNSVGWIKDVPRTKVGPSARAYGGNPDRVARRVESDIAHAPSLIRSIIERTPLDGESDPVVPSLMRITHALTPRDERGTHQFWCSEASSPFAISIDDVARNIQRIFAEDVEAMQLIQQAIDADPDAEFIERSIPTDRYGIRMRRILHDMARAEQVNA